MSGKKGFTLVEIIVVMAILAVLAVIAIPMVTRSREAVAKNACIANMKQIEKAAMLYELYGNGVPAAVSDLVPDYLRREPICPSGTDPYILSRVDGETTVTCPNTVAPPDHVLP